MKIIKTTLKLLIALILLITIGLFFYWSHLKPTYNGNLVLQNISEPVEVYFDNIGVPHIYANKQVDAYTALGYVHAQDRLWQMELIRRIGAGRLSEILGKDLIETDKFFLTMGIDSAADRVISQLDKNSETYKLTMAYLNGINQFIDKGPTPIEYTLVKVKKEHFTIKDIYNVFGYMSFSFAMAQKTDPFLSKLQGKLDKVYIDELSISTDPNTTMIPVYNLDSENDNNFISKLDNIMETLPISPFIGSNAWVIGAEKTAKGKVIFNNDPHIKYSQPGVWYQSHIVCPDFELYGFNLALTPFSLLGHNHDFAYGLTMFENDDIDFYAENTTENDKTTYEVDGVIKKFDFTTKTIQVKDALAVELTIKTSIHGAIMNEFIGYEDSKKDIAMDWIYTKLPNQMLEATYEITHATSLETFKQGVSKIVAPGLNVMYGDSQDNIAWFAAGKLYTHNSGADTHFVLDGANGLDDKLTYIDFKNNPQAINPPSNYVYSANNQPSKIQDSILYPGYYLPEDRAKRITDVLDDLNTISTTEMKSLITDVTSSKAPDLVKIILDNIDEENLADNEIYAYKILQAWKGDFNVNKVAPTIYTKFKYLFLKNIFKDELGEEAFEQFLNTHIVKHQYNKQIENKFSVWSDDITTKQIEDKKQIITKSFKEAIPLLEDQLGDMINEWTWDKVHIVEHSHPIGDKVNALHDLFNVGPFAINGSNEVLNNQIFHLNSKGVYKVTAGPSTRRIVDFSDVENNSFAIIPTGQSGNPFSKHYKDYAEKFVNGEFYKMLLNKDTIQQSEDKLIFKIK
jgi:penicillin amidase